MDRSLLALLSPTEESTLRRLANGGVHPMSLRESTVSRLKNLGLIEQRRTGLALTPMGLQRLGRSPGTVVGEDASGVSPPNHAASH